MPSREKSRNFFSTIALCVAIVLAFPAQAKVIRVVGTEFTHKAVTERQLRAQVEFLCDSLCDGRGTGTPGASEATAWLVRHFRDLGLKAFGEGYVRSFQTPDGSLGRNVIGWLPGNKKDAYVIVTAHYDGLGRLDGRLYPGADSNASGVAALLGLCSMSRELQRIGKAWRKNIIFVALDGKNQGLSGSRAMWDLLETGALVDPETGRPVRGDEVTLVVNIDQLGSTLSPLKSGRKDYLILLSAGAADYHRGSLRTQNDKYGLGLDLGWDYYGSSSFTQLFYERVSDQRPFLEHGRPAVMFTSGITLNNNQIRDTPDTLDYTVLKKRIWLIFHWLERVV